MKKKAQEKRKLQQDYGAFLDNADMPSDELKKLGHQ